MSATATVSDADRAARLALAAVLEPGSGQCLDDVRTRGPVEAWRKLVADQSGVLGERARRYRPAVMHHDMKRHRLRFVVPGDPEWPASLDELEWCVPPPQLVGGEPLGVWLSGPGDLRQVSTSAVAMIGSRAATSTGVVVAAELAAGVAEHGVTVVSGGAYGIDAAAHQGALAVGGPTVAVLAGGLDAVYPTGNATLLERIRAEHLLVSESPPGRPPSRRQFLTRNRLIAALAGATVVVEAQMRSGARNTVSWARGLHRQVLAVPGDVLSSQSQTPNQLIRDNEATLVTSAAEILSEIGPLMPEPVRTSAPALPFDALSPDQKAVHEAFPARGPISVDELAYEARVRVRDCLAALTALDLAGLAQPTDDGRWRLVR